MSTRKIRKGSARAINVERNIARKALALAKKNKKILTSVERKYYEVTNTVTISSDAPQVVLLNGIAAGDDEVTRTGLKTSMTSYNFAYTILPVIAAADQYYVRVMLVRDRQANGAAPTLVQILQSAGANLAIVAHYNRNNVPNRFDIIYDRVHGFDALIKAEQYSRRLNKKLKVDIKYNGNGATIAQITSNSIFLIAVSNVLAAGNVPTMVFAFRGRFMDM